MSSPNYLLLTATIKIPFGMTGIAKVDPQVRLQQYLTAFEFYWKLSDHLFDGIILTDNSGSDFSAFRDISERIPSTAKLITIATSQDYPSDKSKGYGEFFMLDQAITELRAMGIPGDARLWKTTGRLKIANIEEMVRTAPTRFALYGDFRRLPFVGKRVGGNEWLELRLVSMTVDGYDRLFRGHYDDGFVIEYAFFDRLYPIYKAGGSGIVPRFRRQPQYVGRSGWSNKSYTSFSYRLKDGLRKFLRQFLPVVWL